jgi:flagellar basal-body rod protein FlgB
MNGSTEATAAGHVDLFALAEKRLAWVEQRQSLLAQNIANADTPGWRTRDLKPFDALLSGAVLAPVRTSPLHLVAAEGGAVTATAQISERAPDGNAVELDKELAKVADTESAHELVTELYMKYQGMIRTALGR